MLIIVQMPPEREWALGLLGAQAALTFLLASSHTDEADKHGIGEVAVEATVG